MPPRCSCGAARRATPSAPRPSSSASRWRRRSWAWRARPRASPSCAPACRRRRSGARPRSRRRPGVAPVSRLVRRQDVWLLEHEGRHVRLQDSKGLRQLARLLANPQVPIAAVTLVEAAGDPGVEAAGLEPPSASPSVRALIGDLREELAEARAFNDPERAARAGAQLEALADRLVAQRGGGRRGRARPRERDARAEGGAAAHRRARARARPPAPADDPHGNDLRLPARPRFAAALGGRHLTCRVTDRSASWRTYAERLGSLRSLAGCNHGRS